jgi:hypothetical protein
MNLPPRPEANKLGEIVIPICSVENCTYVYEQVEPFHDELGQFFTRGTVPPGRGYVQFDEYFGRGHFISARY